MISHQKRRSYPIIVQKQKGPSYVKKGGYRFRLNLKTSLKNELTVSSSREGEECKWS